MNQNVILPGACIGILGGGQLGRMVAIEAKKMGYDVLCLDPSPNSPCGQVCDGQIVGALDDLNAAEELAKQSDVIIYEFENINVQMVEELEKKHFVPQGSKILGISQDRILEKQSLHQAGFPVVPFHVVLSPEDLNKGIEILGLPCVLKTARGGYDGKGQMIIRNEEDIKQAGQIVAESGRDWVIEKMISFAQEVSAVVARKSTGEVAIFPVGENIHKENILHLTIVPPRVPQDVRDRAAEIAVGIAEAFNVVGLLAVEMFVTAEAILVNELAPRPHNSGHYTGDACITSQFEQIVRAVCNLPFGSPQLVTPVVMVNILGQHISSVLNELPRFPDTYKLHLYGKKGKPEPKRKMGHINMLGHHPEALSWVERVYGRE